jgi:hypothetical protein
MAVLVSNGLMVTTTQEVVEQVLESKELPEMAE